MKPFEDRYGILALVAAKKTTQDEGDITGECLGALETVFYTVNSPIVQEQTNGDSLNFK